jgi:pSer/pThr/pTyr-binding forkhead associated (FHA) protein
MQVILTVVGGIHNGRQIAITVPVFLIGRDPACHLRPASPEVSRQHCAIVLREQRAFLRDYGSRNGTTVNHRVLMHGELQLEDGDLIEVGPLVFKVALSEAATTEVAPAPTDGERGAPPDTTVQLINGEEGLHPDDTVLAPQSKLALGPTGPHDSPEILCPE